MRSASFVRGLASVSVVSLASDDGAESVAVFGGPSDSSMPSRKGTAHGCFSPEIEINMFC